MSARIITVRNATAARIAEWWKPAAPDEVITPWEIDLDTGKMRGRRVMVFPSTATGELASRGEDLNDYAVVVLVAEKYAPGGKIPDEWVDERIEWVEGLLALLGDVRGPRLLARQGEPGSGLWPELADWSTVYDLEELTKRKLFLSELTITYRESAEG